LAVEVKARRWHSGLGLLRTVYAEERPSQASEGPGSQRSRNRTQVRGDRRKKSSKDIPGTFGTTEVLVYNSEVEGSQSFGTPEIVGSFPFSSEEKIREASKEARAFSRKWRSKLVLAPFRRWRKL